MAGPVAARGVNALKPDPVASRLSF